MVVIKSTEGYIFGGYTEQSWEGSGQYKTDYAAFLFSLVNPAGIIPIVQMKAFNEHGKAIFCHNDHGPTFGGINNDLHISSNPHYRNDCSSNIGHTYKLPVGQSGTTFLTGGEKFNVAEMEIFGLQK